MRSVTPSQFVARSTHDTPHYINATPCASACLGRPNSRPTSECVVAAGCGGVVRRCIRLTYIQFVTALHSPFVTRFFDVTRLLLLEPGHNTILMFSRLRACVSPCLRPCNSGSRVFFRVLVNWCSSIVVLNCTSGGFVRKIPAGQEPNRSAAVQHNAHGPRTPKTALFLLCERLPRTPLRGLWVCKQAS